MSIRNVELWCHEGNHDKVYHIAIDQDGPGYTVNFAFGRRGSTLQTGTKTPVPVGMNEANAIVSTLVNAKLAKGYQVTDAPGVVGNAAGGSHVTRVFADAIATCNNATPPALLPQLLMPITEAQARQFIANDAYVGQEKLDGKRILAQRVDCRGAVVPYNKRGKPCDVDQGILAALAGLQRPFIVDGEAIGPVFHVFDLLEWDGDDIREMPYQKRHSILCGAFAGLGPVVRLAPIFAGAADKHDLFGFLKRKRREGMVFKDQHAPSVAGRVDTQYKCKFWGHVTCLVVAALANGKRSITVGLRDGRTVRELGNVTIPSNHDVPEPGQVVEVRYLYAYQGGSLYQTVYEGPRTDATVKDCTVAKQPLKYKANTESEETE